MPHREMAHVWLIPSPGVRRRVTWLFKAVMRG